ncbi:MAG: hypothetical protein OXL36_14925 [Bryobacterales bacterium]|nr:hypothetical protein [Bryobacterales bacterium]
MSLKRFFRRTCLKCHFLSKAKHPQFGKIEPWTHADRASLHIDEGLNELCAHGIWNTGADSKLKSNLQEILLKSRRNSCFFIEYQAGMSLQAAEKLLEHRAAKRGARVAIIALCISFGSLLATCILVTARLLSEKF